MPDQLDSPPSSTELLMRLIGLVLALNLFVAALAAETQPAGRMFKVGELHSETGSIERLVATGPYDPGVKCCHRRTHRPRAAPRFSPGHPDGRRLMPALFALALRRR